MKQGLEPFPGELIDVDFFHVSTFQKLICRLCQSADIACKERIE